MLETMSLERYDREPEARYRNNQTGSHLNDGLQPERRPQRLYLFCNGNRHFKGKVVLVNMRQYRNFGDFLSDVTNRLQPTLPLAHGVRQVFTPVNGRRLRKLSELEDGRSYVCAGFETFKRMPYEELTDYRTIAPPSVPGGKRKKSLRENTKSDSARSSTQDPSPRSLQHPPHPPRPYVTRQRAIGGPNVTPLPPGSKARPRIITIYRNGSKPLQNVKILFNRKSVLTYEQFLNDVADAFLSPSLPSNRLLRLFSVGGREVGGVSDLFRDDESFIATGAERVEMDTVRDVLLQLYPNSGYGDALMRLWEKRLSDAAAAGGSVTEKPVISKADLDRGGAGTEADEGATIQPRRRKGPKMPRRFLERRAEETARLNSFSVLPSIQTNGHVTGSGASDDVVAERRRAELSRFNSSRRPTLIGDAEVFQVGGHAGHRASDVSRAEVTLGLTKKRSDRTGKEALRGAQSPDDPPYEDGSRPGTGSRHLDLPHTLTRDSRMFSPPLTHRPRSQPREDSFNNNSYRKRSNGDNETTDRTRPFSGLDSSRDVATPKPVDPGGPLSDAEDGSRTTPEVMHTPTELDRKSAAKHQRHVASYLVVQEKYELGRILGDGNFAVVKHCMERETGKEFAMKVVDKVKLRGKEDLIENEILIMKACNHPNIVKLFVEYETNSEIFLLMELVGGGDLFEFISQHAPFNEVEAAGMVYDLAKAIAYLHSRSVVHRDVKPENIVVQHGDSELFCLKLADFGLATEVRGPLSTVCGTPTYVAPEILSEIGYGLEIDMWAIGVILYILLCGFAPFRGEDPDQLSLFEAIKSGQFEFTSPYWDKTSEGVRQLITHLLQVDASKRYTAVDVICHPFIVTCAGSFNPPNMEQLRNNLRNELNKDAILHRNSFAAVLAQLK